MDWFSDPEAWVALLTLTSLEIVLGIDNIVFIAILADRVPRDQQKRTRLVGLAVAMFARIALLFSITWIMSLSKPLFAVFGEEISGRDLILLGGGLFLIAKSTHEIHNKLEGPEGAVSEAMRKISTPARVMVQIVLIDIVFSLDSVITAVGMVNRISIMVLAIIIAVAVMMVSSGTISTFVNRHPTVKMLALSFLLLIGVALIADGFDRHIPKGYIYFAMAFSVFVEMLNLKVRGKSEPVKLHEQQP